MRRTRSALRAALLRLTNGAALSELSVARVAAEAGVSRQTFYAHYDDLDQLAVAALVDELEDLRELSRASGELSADAEDPAAPPPGLVRFARFLHERSALLSRALGRDGSPGFAHWLRERVTADVVDGLRQRPERLRTEVPVAVQARFVAGALLATLVPGPTAASDDPGALASQVWTLLRPVLDDTSVTATTAG